MRYRSRIHGADPSLLIIDELSLGLAPGAVELLAESLAKFKAEGITILLVEQDVVTAFEISDYGYILESGRVRRMAAQRIAGK